MHQESSVYIVGKREIWQKVHYVRGGRSYRTDHRVSCLYLLVVQNSIFYFYDMKQGTFYGLAKLLGGGREWMWRDIVYSIKGCKSADLDNLDN